MVGDNDSSPERFELLRESEITFEQLYNSAPADDTFNCYFLGDSLVAIISRGVDYYSGSNEVDLMLCDENADRGAQILTAKVDREVTVFRHHVLSNQFQLPTITLDELANAIVQLEPVNQSHSFNWEDAIEAARETRIQEGLNVDTENIRELMQLVHSRLHPQQ